MLIAACATPTAPPPATPATAPGPPKVTELRVVPDGIDARPWLAPDSARAIAAGAGPLRVLGAEVVAEGDRVGAFVEIPEDECLLAFSRASPALADADLFAYEDDGSTFAADESPEPAAAILACPPHPRRLYVTARAMSGTGILAVGVHAVPRASADAVAKVMGVRGRAGEDSGRLDAWPGLESKIRVHRDSLGGRWEDVRRLAMPASPRAPTRLSATLDANRCLDVLVAPSDEIASLEVTVEDAEARTIARARELGRDRTLLLCASASAPITLTLRPRGTLGLAAVILGRSMPGGEAEIADRARVVHVTETRDLEEARRGVAAELASLGYEAPRAIASGTARVGARAAAKIDLPAGCARVDVIAGKPLVELAASLWDDRGALVAEGRAGASLALFSCGKGGAARLDFEAIASPGPFAIELRKDKAAPPALVARPAAAARLLARLSAGGRATDASAAAGASVVALEENQLKSMPLAIPAGTCVEVIAALDAGGSGLEMRLAAGDDPLVTRARYVVADRACAPPAGKPATMELRLLSGKSEALVLTRPAAERP
jgi:hypothetical protein